MNWKIFITASVSILSAAIPENMIGCGPEQDPYDYYTSFFHQNLPDAVSYRPFYYSGFTFLYDENEPVSKSDLLANEWAAYCGVPVIAKEASDFVNDYGLKDVNSLYYNIEKAQPLKIPDSLKKNGMTNYFLQKKDLEALGYIIYAKKVAPYVTGNADQWEPVERDSVAMAKFIKNGQQLYAVAKNDLFKLKFAYQLIRLAHYSGNYADAIKFYDEYVPANNTRSILQPMCLALKAGALFHTGRTKEAAYLFSKVFSDNEVNRVSNYISFNWSVGSKQERADCLELCKNNSERADMLALFALSDPGNALETMKEIYRLKPAAAVLEVLAVREINKQEESYFTPELNRQHGGKQFFYTWENSGVKDNPQSEGKAHIQAMADFFNSVAQKTHSGNAGLFETGAAYCAYMINDYKAAHQYIAAAEKIKLTDKVKDQLQLTSLLLGINEKDNIDAAFEAQLLPSLKWLQKKAETEKAVPAGYSGILQWRSFYRNLLSEIIAKRYHRQGDIYKEVLAIGAADRIYGSGDNYYSNALEYLHDKLESNDVEKLYALMSSRTKTPYENYLVGFNSLKLNDVMDFAGTAYLRDYNYSSAIGWLKKSVSSKKYSTDKDPFIELLYDQEEKLPEDRGITTKLAFATEMLRLERLTQTGRPDAAKNYYRMALGMYNTTYYGHTWELVQYLRSGADGYYIPAGANNFQKEYYGCYKAHDYFKKAMDASADKNFKAKCLFMMARCAQKQIRQPQYSDFGSGYDKYDEAQRSYMKLFTSNRYFPQFINEYRTTAFYDEAFNSCSYLSDFVHRK